MLITADSTPGQLDAGLRLEPSRSGPTPPRPIRLLTFSTLYPHRGKPNHGVFVENRLRHLVASGQVVSTVIAPVPWFPSRSKRFGEWAIHAEADRVECRHGINVHHPRFAVIPYVGMSLAPIALFAAAVLELRRLMAAGLEFDIIDAHYIYPDGVAATALGRAVNKPVVLTARGSDITQFPAYAAPRRMIRWAMSNAAALISVSAGLKSAMVELGALEHKISVLRNGVDLDQFRQLDPTYARQEWGVSGKVLISVGHLIERKGHHLTVEALAHLPNWTLILVGAGPEKTRLEALATRLGLEDRVIFSGARPHAQLASYYSAADICVLASSREGWANVLLESMACGTPVIASNIPGNEEVVTDIAAGLVVRENTPACFATTINYLDGIRRSRHETRAYAEAFDWTSTSEGQMKVFRNILA